MFPSFFYSHRDVFTCLENKTDHKDISSVCSYLKGHKQFNTFASSILNKLGEPQSTLETIDAAFKHHDRDAYCVMSTLINYYFLP